MTAPVQSPTTPRRPEAGGDAEPARRPLERLFEMPHTRGPSDERRLTPALRVAYDGDLIIRIRDDRPTLVANFVETIDGVVALAPGTRSGGGDVSGHDPVDRFVMSLLRALSDVVLVGAGTARAASGAGWTADGTDAATTADLAELRRASGLPPQPITLIATQTGDLDPALPAFRDPRTKVVIAGPDAAVTRLRSAGFSSDIKLVTTGHDPASSPHALMDIARDLGARLVLSEAGPHLTAELAAAGWLDELFLTLAPRLVGRDQDTPRLALLEGVALTPTAVRNGRLVSVRRAGDTMFLRYRLTEDSS
jgi:5-amino-6-(5-phosphoribosylamino)uracil reductase